MELRRELRMEANVFAEDDDFDGSDDDDGNDAVVGTPARSRAARRPTTTSRGASRLSSRAFESPSRDHRLDDFEDALSPMRGLGSATIAQRRPKPTPTPSRRRRGADVFATPTRSEAPPARSAALADRLVLAPPSSSAPRSSTRGRGRGGDTEARRERLRSPSLDRLAGTYRSLGALATASAGPKRVSSAARVSCSSSADARRARAARAPGDSREANVSARSRRGDANPPTEPSLRSRRATASAAPTGVRAPRRETDDGSRRARAALAATRPETRRVSGSNPTRWRTVVEYDLNGRRVERKVLAPPPSARRRPAWSSRPGTRSGPIRAATEPSDARDGAGTMTNSKTRRPASRPAFDPGPGGFGVDHRAGAARDASTAARPAPASARKRSARVSPRRRPATSGSAARDRRATTPAPASARSRRDAARLSAPVSSDDDDDDDASSFDRSTDASPSRDPRRRTTPPRADVAEPRPWISSSDSERDVGDRAARRATRRRRRSERRKRRAFSPTEKKRACAERSADAKGARAKATADALSPSARADAIPNPFVDVRDDAGDEGPFPDGAFFAGLGRAAAEASSRPATARSRVRTPSTSGRRAALGGFDGYGSAFGYRSHREKSRPNSAVAASGTRTSGEFGGGYHRAAPPSAPASPAAAQAHWMGVPLSVRRPYTAAPPGPSPAGLGGGPNHGSFDDAAARAFGDSRAYDAQQLAWRSQQVPPFGMYGHHDAPTYAPTYASEYAHAYAPAPAPAHAPAYAPAYAPAPFAAFSYHRAPPATGAAASFQRWSTASGTGVY